MPELIHQEEEIFEAALEIADAGKRDVYIQNACRGDAKLLRQVHSLLQAHAQAEGFLNGPAPSVRLTAAAGALRKTEPTERLPECANIEKAGDQIGRYKLLQKIGEGGCGVVYMAEQEEPVRRRVALKIIKLGMDTRQVIARFEAERQALAMMDHRNIARVLDAGATETGRPFFVMELVRGIRITDYCDQNQLSTEERLRLFKQVCQAIQHAHQKGIIHRDIKPSNILVTLQDGDPVPVIIDFGIAKATEQRLTDKTLFTAFEQFIGTPAYTSPEQAEMSRLDIDTRSDIYSLGVLLYELLTGKTPFDPGTLVQSGIDEMRRTIREKEPLRPSTRLSTMLEADLTSVAKHRRSEPLRLIHLLRGDLDWIVMKCLEKDRTRRYETANELALDIERYLENEPVLARPPSSVYRLEKLVRRNKVAVLAGAAVVLALLIGLAISLESYVLQRRAYRRAVLAERNQSRLREQAESAQLSEAAERRRSELVARQSRLSSYAADIYSASLALQAGNLGRAADLLKRQTPRPGEEDLRGFEWRYLWQQLQGDELLSLPHDALVSCAVFSGDGQRLATASYDGLLRIWDLATRRVIRSIAGFQQQYDWHYIAYSANGKWLAGIRSGVLTVWDCSSADHPVVFSTQTAARVLAFSPDSTRLVGWGDAGLSIVDTATWNVQTVRTKLVPGASRYPCLSIDRSSNLAALGYEGEPAIEVCALDLSSPPRIFNYPDVTGAAFVSLAWSPDGLLAAATWSGRLLLVDGRTGQELGSRVAHLGSIFGLAFAPDDPHVLVSAGHDQCIRFWNVPNLELTATLHGHRDEIWSLAFSPDGHRLCTAGKDGTAKIWSTTPKAPAPLLPDWYVGEFSADGKFFVTLSEPLSETLTEVSLGWWDVDNPGVRSTKSLPVTDAPNIVRVTLGPRARLLALARKDGSIEVWDLDAGKLQNSTRLQATGPTVLAFSDDGRRLAIGTDSGAVELWDLPKGETRTFAGVGTGRITAIQFTPGAQYIRASREGQRAELLWETKTGQAVPLPVLPGQPFQVSADGRTLAGANTNYTVALWSLPDLHQRAVLQGHRWRIASVAFSPHDDVLATGSLDGTGRLWDVSTGRELTPPLRGHLQGVTQLAFSPDGSALATDSTDQTVKLWHVATGRELISLGEVYQPRFSPDGNTLLLRTSRGTRLIHVPTLAEIDQKR